MLDCISEYNKYNLGPLCKLRDWIPIENLRWDNLSGNPNAIHLLEQNLKKIDWYYLSANPNAIPILEQNQDKINWAILPRNLSIFEYDYEAMRLRMKPLAEQLIANRFHPRNFDKWLKWGFDECQECEF